MTTSEFYSWLKEQGCTVRPLHVDKTGRVMKISSPSHPGIHVYHFTPNAEKPVKCYIVCNICDQLSLAVYDNCSDHAKVAEMIKSKYNPNFGGSL